MNPILLLKHTFKVDDYQTTKEAIQMPAVDGAVAKMLHAWRTFFGLDENIWRRTLFNNSYHQDSYIVSTGPL